MEEPVRGGYAPAFHFHAALTGRRRPTLRGDDGVQVRAPRQKRLWTAPGMGHPLHRAQVPREGVVGVSEQGAGQRPLGGCEPGIPAGLLGLKPAPSPRPLGAPRRGGPMLGTTASPLAAPPPRTPCRGRARSHRVWPCARHVVRTADGSAVRGPGRVWSAWRRQGPRRAPGQSGRRLPVVRSTPALRRPRTRYDGSCGSAAGWTAPDAWVKAAALAASVSRPGQRPRPLPSGGRDTGSVSPRRCGAAARPETGRARPHRVRPGPSPWWPTAHTQRASALGARGERTAHGATRRPPGVAHRASRAPSGRL